MGQYIGARYVPRFMGTYDPTQIYEALDVVDNGLGTSYISRIPTPANTPLTNTTYWKVYGASSGAIINLQNQIDDMKDGTVPGSLQAQIDDNTSDITALSNKVAVFDDNALNTNFSNRKIVFLGDSYNYTDGGWISKLIARLSLNSANVYDYTVTGHGFNNGQWLNDLTNFVTDHNNIVNDITDIIIIGGVNDSTVSALSALRSQINAFVAYAAVNLPNAFISVAFVGSATQQSTVMADRTYSRRMQALSLYKECLNKKNCRLLAGTFNALCQYTLFDADGLHPNQYGNDKIVESVAQALLSGKADVILGDSNADTTYLFNVESGVVNDFSFLNVGQWLLPNNTTIPVAGGSTTAYTQLPATVSLANAPKTYAMVEEPDGSKHWIVVWVSEHWMQCQSIEISSNVYTPISLPNGGRIFNLRFIKPTADM